MGLVAVSLQEAVEAATKSNPPWHMLSPAVAIRALYLVSGVRAWVASCVMLDGSLGSCCGQFAGSCGGSDQKQCAVAYTDSGCCGVRSGWGLLRSVCRKLDAATKSNLPWHILSPAVAAHHRRLHANPLHCRCAQVKAFPWGPAGAKPEVCRL